MFPAEKFLIPRPLKTRSEFSVAWFYPNTYTVGMAGLGYQLVFRLLDADEDIGVLRGFTDMEEPGISGASIFGFTFSWELDYANIVSILRKHNIPVSAKERDESHPLILAADLY